MSTITIRGNLAAAPESRPAGQHHVANFVILENRRVKSGGQWVDAPPNRFTVECWDALASNVCASLTTGSSVLVTGTVKTETWTTSEGEPRSKQVIEAEDVAVSLRRATATPIKNQPTNTTRETDPWAEPAAEPSF